MTSKARGPKVDEPATVKQCDARLKAISFALVEATPKERRVFLRAANRVLDIRNGITLSKV